MTTSRIPYQGTTPGADTSNYVLFSTTVWSPAQACMLQMAGIKRLVLDLAISQAGELHEYKSSDRGATWTEVSDESVSVPAAGTVYREYAVEPYADYKLEWTNGGSAQATWKVDLALDCEGF